MSPTQRTLAELKRQNVPACVSEKWIPSRGHPAGGVRKDLFGFVDVVALGETVIGVQATSGTNVAARVKKIREECGEAAKAWLRSGGTIQVWGWRKLAKPVNRRYWQPRIVEVTIDDLS